MTTSRRPRVIFDCNVLLQGTLNPDGPAGRCVRLIEDGDALLLLSPALIAEARDVLNRPFIRLAAPRITPEAVEFLLDRLRYTSEVTLDVPSIQPWPRDPFDEPYLDLAITAKADFIVTRDRDLLDLLSDHSLEAKQFRQITRNCVAIVSPSDFLRRCGR